MKYGVLIEETLRKAEKCLQEIGQKVVFEFSMLYITRIHNMFQNLF
jgi:hypothetical protein